MQHTHIRQICRAFAILLVAGQLAFVPATVSFALADTSSPPLPSPTLIISAVQTTGGTNHTQEDFIEVYNSTDTAMDLKGFRLVKRTSAGTTDSLIKSWTSSTMVEAHHFYLWANSAFSGIPVVPDATSTATIADNNGVALRFGANDTGTVVDSMAWGSTANGFENAIYGSLANPGPGQSLQRADLFDVTKGIAIVTSSPRNSTNEFLPPEPDPVVTPDPVDTAETSVTPDITPVLEGPPITPEPATIPDIVITEILPNPTGTDSGAEQVELYNAGTTPADLSGFVLDDVAPTDTLTSNAVTLPTEEIPADAYSVVTIPAGGFAMNNTGGDIVTLFAPDQTPIDTIEYTDTAPEAQTYTDFDNTWEWVDPTLGQDNGSAPEETSAPQESTNTVTPVVQNTAPPAQTSYDESGLQISEIYANPQTGDSEFLEIYNSGEETADLSVVTLWVGDKHKNLPNVKLQSQKYYVLETGLPAQLRNDGQSLKLTEQSKTLDTISYPSAIKASSYSRFEDGFQWTTSVTKGTSNKLSLPQPVVEVAKQLQKDAKKLETSPATKPTVKTTTKTPAKTASATATKPTTTTNSNTNKASTSQVSDPKPSTPKNNSVGKLVAMGAAAVTAGVAALYKLVFPA